MRRVALVQVGVLVLCLMVGGFAFSGVALAAAPEEPVTVSPAKSITSTSATLEGVLNPNAAGEAGQYGFFYRASASQCTEAGVAPEPEGIALGLKGEAVSTVVTGLQPGTQYTFCVFGRSASSPEEPAIGQPVTFTTLAVAPSVSEEFVTGVASDGATLHGEVDPGGAATTFHFEYGTTPAYGQSTPESGSVGSDDAGHAAIAHIQGLQAGTTYHYRIVASNSVAPGGVDGPDHTFTTQTVGGEGLPDGRHYELVTPADKGDGSIPSPRLTGQESIGAEKIFQASTSGEGLAFSVRQAFPGAQWGSVGDYLASRSPGGWSSQSLIPPQEDRFSYGGPRVYSFSSDLSRFTMADGGENHSYDDPPLVSGEPENNQNLFLHEISTGSWQLMNRSPGNEGNITYLGASADLSHVLFYSQGVSGASLFQWAGGVVSLVANGVGLGGPSPGEEVPLTAVSSDGSRIVFTVPTSTESGHIYVRENNTTTTLVGEGRFVGATPSGSKIFFTNGDLYVYEVESGHTVNLTLGDSVQGLLGVSEDGSYVYFVDESDRLLLWHDGVTTPIATLAGADSSDWMRREKNLGFTARVTPDGTHLAFNSVRSLTGFDNRDVVSGQPDDEIYLYDATTSQLVCASCDPSGARPTGGASIAGSEVSVYLPAHGWEGDEYLPRNLSEDGSRLFFETADALVPGDTNDQQDVYEFEGGRPHLISSGTSDEPSSFLDASPSGDDVFFETQAQLVPQDVDQSFDIYDARVGSRFPAPTSSATCAGAGCQGALPAPSAFAAPMSSTFSGAGNLPAPVVSGAKPKAKAKPKLCRRGYMKKRGRCVKESRRAKKAAATTRRGK